MNDDLEGALKAYMLLMEEAGYFEAHEVLEEAWHPLRLRRDPLADLVKGLINGAVAFEHIKRGRENYAAKAKKVITSYERHKHLCVEGIEYHSLFSAACQKIEVLKKDHEETFNVSVA
jgi:predicted metal-dependent hydrolase